MSILTDITQAKYHEVALRRQQLSLRELEQSPVFERPTISLSQRLKTMRWGIVAEFKRKSPSKGLINGHADAGQVVSGYFQHGAAGVSVLTDEPFFGGTADDLRAARAVAAGPLLRKDFVIDEYQLYEAKAWGADVVLLIAACLSDAQVLGLARKARDLGLEVLLEVHGAEELSCLNPYVSIVGVNNRNLNTFEVSLDTSVQLAELIPSGLPKISESGIHHPSDIQMLKSCGFDGFLIGENFMKQADPAGAFRDFIHKLNGL